MGNASAAEDSLPGLSNVSNSPARGVSRAGAARSAKNYEKEIVDSERQVAEANEKTVALNDRIVSVLTGTTEKSLGSEPRPWWDWWSDYTDYYHGGSRPVNSTVDSSNDYIIPPMQSGSSAVECFVRGTPVWTKTGQRPIEKLQAGDLVLARTSPPARSATSRCSPGRCDQPGRSLRFRPATRNSWRRAAIRYGLPASAGG